MTPSAKRSSSIKPVNGGKLVSAQTADESQRDERGRMEPSAQTDYVAFSDPIPGDPSLDLGLDKAVPLSLERAFKRGLDVVGALVLATVFSPLFLCIYLVMRHSGSNVLFKHRRVGKNGVVFECLKFCTMVPNAEQVLRDLLASDHALREEWDRDHKLRNDPRVTRLGKFLRSTSLDELPQIWNVLKGEMSLVGPRPVTREELLRYGRNMLLYMMVRPGITGLWQVSGRSTTDYRRRVAIDVCYVRNQSVLLDIWILLKTTLVVLGRRGAY